MPCSSGLSRRHLLLTTASATLLGGGQAARAEQWPLKPVTFVVPFTPGNGTDIVARYFARRLQELTKQNFLVDNRAGANGLIGAQAVLRAPADGYTLFFASGSSMATNVALYKTLPYDPVADFVPIAGAMRGSTLVVVPANSPFKTLADLIAAAKAKPKGLSYGSASSAYNIGTEYFASVLGGLELLHVPYKGTAQVLSDTASGVIDLSFASVAAGLPLVKSGQLRALAITSDRRLAALPDVPTAIEGGAKDYEFYAWAALYAPAKTPQPVVDRLVELMAKVSAEPETAQFMLDAGNETFPFGPQEMRRYHLSEIELWKRMAQRAGVQPQ